MTTNVEPATTPVDQRVIDVLLGITRLDTQRWELQARGDLPALARLLVGCRELLLNLGAVADSIEADVAELMGDRRNVEVDGVGYLQRKARYNDHYESGQLLRLLLEHALADEDGTVDHAMKSRLMETLTAALSITPSTYWKEGGLEPLGIDLDEYKARTYGRDRIEIK